MRHFLITGFLLTSVFLAGCHGDVFTLRLPDMDAATAMEESRLAIAVDAIRAQHSASEPVGVHHRRGGGKRYFSMRDGSLGHVVTQSLIRFLNQSGFSASAADDAGSGDVRIETEITRFKADVTDGLLFSSIEVDTTMAFTIHNADDGSTVRVTIGVGETSEMPFFVHHDLEKVIGSTFEEGFTKLLKTVEVRGRALKSAQSFSFNS